MPAWRVEQGHGSFLTFNFGPPRAAAPEYGRWHLWVYDAEWQISRQDTVIADSDDSRDVIGEALGALSGEPLLRVEFDRAHLTTYFDFGADSTLAVTNAVIDEDDDEGWMFFVPDHQVMCYGPRDRLTIGNADQP